MNYKNKGKVLRKQILSAAINAGKGHVPPAFSWVEIGMALFYGKILNFNDNSDLKRSWEMGFNDSTIESQISPGGMIKTLNTKFNKNIKNLDEFLESKESLTILKNASKALSSLIQSRTNFFRLNGLEPEIVVIGQRLGLFLSELKEEIQEMFYQSSKIPLKFSIDRRTAALGAIYKMIKY